MGKEKRNQLINKDAPNMPGAGAYSIPTKINEGPAHVMAKRVNDENKYKSLVPGPG